MCTMMPGSNDSGKEGQENFNFYYVPPPSLVMNYSINKTLKRINRVLSMDSEDQHIILVACKGNSCGPGSEISLSMKGSVQY